jgi:hypothetical protein
MGGLGGGHFRTEKAGNKPRLAHGMVRWIDGGAKTKLAHGMVRWTDEKGETARSLALVGGGAL